MISSELLPRYFIEYLQLQVVFKSSSSQSCITDSMTKVWVTSTSSIHKTNYKFSRNLTKYKNLYSFNIYTHDKKQVIKFILNNKKLLKLNQLVKLLIKIN